MMTESPGEKIRELANLMSVRQTVDDEIFRLKAELIQEMHHDGATEILDPDFEVKLTSSKITPDDRILRPLLESKIGDKLIKSGAYTPAHTKTIEVPEKWFYPKLNSFKKFGSDIADTIEESKIRTPGISIKPKKKKRGDDNDN
mgnify:CR=1 FL=1